MKKNCLPDLRAWFADLQQGSEANRQIKLMINGNGNVGKSSVLEALEHGKCVTKHDSTHGIILVDLPLGEVQFKAWDFGGQEIYFGTHRIFLSSKAVNLIVFDRETERLPSVSDRINEDEQTRNHKLDYWLQTIKELNKESPVIAVQNKRDKHEYDTETATYAAKNSCFVDYVSANTGKGIGSLQKKIEEEAAELPDFGMLMPASWLKVRQRANEAVADPTHPRLIERAQFSEWCAEEGVLGNSEEALLRYLHHSGTLYFNEQYLKNNIILDQKWALDGIYTVLNRKSGFYEDMREVFNGKIKLKRLLQAWDTQYSEEDRRLFVQFLESCGQCFRYGETDAQSDEDLYVFPEFLPGTLEHNAQRNWELISPEAQFCCYRFKHELLHFYRIQQIIVALGRKTLSRNIWRNGIQVETPEGWLRITADYDAKAIEVQMEEKVRNRWLKEIVELVQGEKAGLSWEQQLKDWEEQLPDGSFVSVREIERFHLRAPKHGAEGPGEQEETKAKSLPELLPDTRKKEIMVAYAKEYKEELKEVLTYLKQHHDLFEVWYDHNLRYDEVWHKQILRQINNCDGVVILVGPEYLSTEKQYIHEVELPEILKRYEKDKMLPVMGLLIRNTGQVWLMDRINFYDKAIAYRDITTKRKKDAYLAGFVKEFREKHFTAKK